MLTFARSLFINAFLTEESHEEYRANAMLVFCNVGVHAAIVRLWEERRHAYAAKKLSLSKISLSRLLLAVNVAKNPNASPRVSSSLYEWMGPSNSLVSVQVAVQRSI